MSDLVNEIDVLKSQHNAKRRQQHALDAPPTIPSNYYAPSLKLPHSGTNGPPSRPITSSSTHVSPAFRRSTPQTSTNTYGTATQRPPTFRMPAQLVCEFTVFSNCDKTFDLEDEAGWIIHIAKDHLNYHFPSKVICWFCYRKFTASSNSQIDTEACYRERMHHIAKHIRNGHSSSPTRPDVFLLKHLSKYGLINGDVAQRTQAYHKAPTPNLYPVDWKSEDRDEMPHLMEDNESSSAYEADRSYQRSQPLLAVNDYIIPPVGFRSLPIPNRARPLQCSLCMKLFHTNRDLNKHSRIHSTAMASPSSFPNRSLPQEDNSTRQRLVTGCGPKHESGEEHIELDHNSTNILAKDRKPRSYIGTEDRLPNSSSTAHIPNNSAALDLPSENGTQSQFVKLETDLSEGISETCTVPFHANYGQQHALPFLPKLSDDLESRGSSPTTQSDGSSNPTETYVDERKRQIIDSIVFNVAQWMRSILDSCRKNAGGNSGGASDTPDESQGSGSKAKTSNSTRPSYQKRRLTEVDDDETDEDDEERHEENRQSGEKLGQDRENRKYACPYFRYNPTKYRGWRICPGPGWADIHRVKEHLYRRHRQPKYRCGRCWQPFKDEQCHLNLLRNIEACPLREMEPIEGFDEAQERSLKSRKRPGRELSEDDKWRRVFKILFPHVSDDDIPSPFYEYDQTSRKEDNCQHSESDYLAQCEDYMVREVPQRLRQALGRELDRDLTIVEESLRRKAGDWVKTLLEEAFRELRQNRDGDGQSLPGEELGLPIEGSSILASQEGSSSNDNLPNEGQSEAWLSNFNLDSFDPFALLGETEFAFDNGGLLEDLLGPGGGGSDTGATREHSDSGYRSFSSMQLEKATGEQ